MSTSPKVTALNPKEVRYKGYLIKLTHRPKTNDWSYSITAQLQMKLSDKSPRYATALAQAKSDIDALTQ